MNKSDPHRDCRRLIELSYIAKGFLSHNSQFTPELIAACAIPITLTGIVDVL
jgi:hypothetical protein